MFYILEYYYHITILELILRYVRNNKQKNIWVLIDINVTFIILFGADEDRHDFWTDSNVTVYANMSFKTSSAFASICILAYVFRMFTHLLLCFIYLFRWLHLYK